MKQPPNVHGKMEQAGTREAKLWWLMRRHFICIPSPSMVWRSGHDNSRPLTIKSGNSNPFRQRIRYGAQRDSAILLSGSSSNRVQSWRKRTLIEEICAWSEWLRRCWAHYFVTQRRLLVTQNNCHCTHMTQIFTQIHGQMSNCGHGLKDGALRVPGKVREHRIVCRARKIDPIDSDRGNFHQVIISDRFKMAFC